MSNASLKEQLQAVASQITEKTSHENKPKQKLKPEDKISKPKPKWLDYAQYGVELLRAYFPEGFSAPSEVKPLKKGIKQDLVKRLGMIETIVTEDKACMIKSLTYYVNTSAYHKSVLEGVDRIDLDGNPDGKVSAEEAKYSFDKHQAKLIERQNARSGTKESQSKVN